MRNMLSVNGFGCIHHRNMKGRLVAPPHSKIRINNALSPLHATPNFDIAFLETTSVMATIETMMPAPVAMQYCLARIITVPVSHNTRMKFLVKFVKMVDENMIMECLISPHDA